MSKINENMRALIYVSRYFKPYNSFVLRTKIHENTFETVV